MKQRVSDRVYHDLIAWEEVDQIPEVGLNIPARTREAQCRSCLAPGRETFYQTLTNSSTLGL